MVEILASRRLKVCIPYLIVLALTLIGCTTDNRKPKSDNLDFLRLKENGFTLRGEPFFPMMLNYVADFRIINDSAILGVHIDYETTRAYEYNALDSIVIQRREHLTLIKDMGFNSIRLCLDRIWFKDGINGYPTGGKLLSLSDDTELILNGIEEYLKDAAANNLKVIILIPPPIDSRDIEAFTIELLKRFRNNPTVFAYDFNNEPLYDRRHSAMDKEAVVDVVEEWDEWMEDYAPDQFLTIGFSEPIEVFSWDPSILPVDFLSFHTYNPLRVPNEIDWYTNYSNKPWMIGETALLADGEDIPFAWQSSFMKAAFEHTINQGGIGFGWWGFQEVPKHSYSEESTGITIHGGPSYTSDSLLALKLSFKPSVKTIGELNPKIQPKRQNRRSNYFNMVGYTNYVTTGLVLDEDGRPIEGAAIRGWNRYYRVGQNTFSDKDGKFSLYSNDVIHHLKVSAPGKSVYDLNKPLEYQPIHENVVPEDSLPSRDLEYQKIDYRDFIMLDQDSMPVFFEYRDGVFKKASYSTTIGKIELKDWDD